MKTLITGGNVLMKNGFVRSDMVIADGKVFALAPEFSDNEADRVIRCDNSFIIPAFADVHVHLREPGFEYKETIRTGTMAAARGGYSAVCSMPNLKPAPSSPEALKAELEAIKKDAVIKVYPYGTITRDQSGTGELSDMAGLAAQTVAFTDDGKGIQKTELMSQAMRKAKELDKIIVAHCEDESWLPEGGCVHDGQFARRYGFAGIPSESEWCQAERDLDLERIISGKYHICHVSTKETVELVRRAKEDGVDVTCETAPHYLVLCEDDIIDDGRFKMNPPVRSAEDREALIEGIIDGTVDMIATDHAPHAAEEKSRGLQGSAFGIVGLETAFPVLFTQLVLGGRISLEKLIKLMSVAPRRRFGLDDGGENSITAKGYICAGQTADIAVLDIEDEYCIDPADFASMGKSTPFAGMKVRGRVLATFADGKEVYNYKGTDNE
ncbi:MAG: dihydroorotase [Eubacteriaceae bacterium]|jgi:dihydroorotase|nr:dihydroorotase [Eubacteriaceae bacterium]